MFYLGNKALLIACSLTLKLIFYRNEDQQEKQSFVITLWDEHPHSPILWWVDKDWEFGSALCIPYLKKYLNVILLHILFPLP